MISAPRIPPGSEIDGAGYRLLMVTAAARLALRRKAISRPLRRALLTTALGRIPDSDRAWIDRIEAARPQLAAGAIAATEDSVDRPEAERLEEANTAVKWMSLPPILGRLLLRIVREREPRSCLELGTGFGISTSYQAAGLEINGEGRVRSLDIDGMIALARPGIAQLGLESRIEFVGGEIERTLDTAVAAAGPIDFALLDADHTEAATVAAFDAICPGLRPGPWSCSTTSTGPTACGALGRRSNGATASRKRSASAASASSCSTGDQRKNRSASDLNFGLIRLATHRASSRGSAISRQPSELSILSISASAEPSFVAMLAAAESCAERRSRPSRWLVRHSSSFAFSSEATRRSSSATRSDSLGAHQLGAVQRISSSLIRARISPSIRSWFGAPTSRIIDCPGSGSRADARGSRPERPDLAHRR